MKGLADVEDVSERVRRNVQLRRHQGSDKALERFEQNPFRGFAVAPFSGPVREVSREHCHYIYRVMLGRPYIAKGWESLLENLGGKSFDSV